MSAVSYPQWRELWEIARSARDALDVSFGAEDLPDDDDETREMDPAEHERFAMLEMQLEDELGARRTQRARVFAARIEAGFEACRFVAAASADAAAVEMLPMLAWLAEHADAPYRERRSTTHALGAAIHHAALRARERPEDFEELARDPRVDVRKALAGGLVVSPDRTFERDLLCTLAGDDDRDVRASARAQLVEALPWWHARFPTDPAPSLADAQQPALATLRAAYDRRAHDLARIPPDELLFAAQTLPLDVGVPLLASMARATALWNVFAPTLLGWIGRLPGRFAEVLSILDAMSAGSAWIGSALDPLSAVADARKLELCLALANSLLVAPTPTTERTRRANDVRAHALAKLWPRRADPEPLLAVILGGAPTGAEDRPRSAHGWALSDAIDPEHPALERHRAAIERAIAAGLPGAWDGLPYAVREHFTPRGSPPQSRTQGSKPRARPKR